LVRYASNADVITLLGVLVCSWCRSKSARDAASLFLRRQLNVPPANAVLHESIAWLLTRPVGRPPHEVRRYHM